MSPGPATPYYYAADGIREAYIRNGNQSIIAPSHILDELILKGQNKSYDSIQTKLLKNDYSFSIFEADFLEKTHTKLTIEDYISFSLMDANGFLTNAGVLLADQYIYRHNRIFCTRWNGTTKTSLEEASDDIELTGGLIELLKSTLKFIKNNTKKKWKKEPQGRVEMPDYDELAIREVIVNALIHRQYTNVGSEISVNIYDDRIEITSPGGMVSGQTIQGTINEKIPSLRRNPIIADVFARMKYMDRRGSGFDKIKDKTNSLFDDDKNHVQFYATNTFFSVIIENANYKNDKVNDKVNLSKNAVKVLELIKENPFITRLELARKINKSESTINRVIKELKENKLIDEKTSDKNGSWVVVF